MFQGVLSQTSGTLSLIQAVHSNMAIGVTFVAPSGLSYVWLHLKAKLAYFNFMGNLVLEAKDDHIRIFREWTLAATPSKLLI